VDGSMLSDGDDAGICAHLGRYGMLAVTKENGKYYLVMKGNPGKHATRNQVKNMPGYSCLARVRL